LSLPVFDPVRPRKRDRVPAWFSDWGFSGAALHALRSGWLMPPLLPGRVPGLKGSFDWLGVNYYGRYTVEFDPLSPEFLGHRPSDGHIKTAWTDWGEPSPDGLTRRLLALARLGVPLYVTENGIRDAEDELRPQFLREHVSAVSRVIALGADVRGYFHWSLVDNFEWAEGWSSRFGLFALDRATGIRTARASADLYARICRTNGAALDSLR
jgi:beta-glucosidase